MANEPSEAEGPARVRDDYGEPWGVKTSPGDHYEEAKYYTADRDGRAVLQMIDGPAAVFSPRRTWAEFERLRDRIIRCVNLLSGVPDAVLADPCAAAELWATLAAMGHPRPPVAAVEVPCPRCRDQRFPGYFGSDSLADAFSIERENRRCQTCGGTGKVTEARPAPGPPGPPACLTCKGAGDVSYRERGEYGHEWLSRTCPSCKGAKVQASPSPPPAPPPPPAAPLPPCWNCRGSGGWRDPTGGFQEFSGTYPAWKTCHVCKGQKVIPPRRTRAEVLAAKRTPAGCCDRHGDNLACDCLRDAAD